NRRRDGDDASVGTALQAHARSRAWRDFRARDDDEGNRAAVWSADRGRGDRSCRPVPLRDARLPDPLADLRAADPRGDAGRLFAHQSGEAAGRSNMSVVMVESSVHRPWWMPAGQNTV